MPIPRRFDRRPPERDTTRINEQIRVSEVRLIGDDGEQIGVLSREDALAYAQERDLDLVEVAPEASPPVCRVLDYSKYKYEQEQKQKAARKHQQQINVREIKLRPKIAVHDYETKKGHVERFLKQRDKVKVTIMFRGRETAYPERGRRLLDRLAADVAELGVVEQEPLQDGRNMIMVLGPSKHALTVPAAQAAPVDATEPEAAEPEAAEPEAAEPEAAQPEATKPEATKPDAAEPEAVEAEAAEPEAQPESEESEPEVEPAPPEAAEG